MDYTFHLVNKKFSYKYKLIIIDSELCFDNINQRLLLIKS